jgi:serine phosphatase RsbU (regulator of sigma subunit)
VSNLKIIHKKTFLFNATCVNIYQFIKQINPWLMKKKFIFLFILSFLFKTLYSQSYFDTLLKKYSIEKNDSLKIETLSEILNSCEINDIDKYAKITLTKILELEKKNLKNKKSMNWLNEKKANTYHNIGFYYINKSEPDKALSYYKKSIELSKDNSKIGETCNNIAYVYQNQGNIKKSQEYYFLSIQYKEKAKDTLGSAVCYNNIAYNFFILRDSIKGLNYLNKSLKIRKKYNDKLGMGFSYMSLAYYYQNKKKYSYALQLYNLGLNHHLSINEKVGVSAIYSNIANLYLIQNKLDSAQFYFSKSLEIRIKNQDNMGIAGIFTSLSDLYYIKKEYDKMKYYALKGHEIAKKIGYPEILVKTSHQLSNIHAREKKWKEAYDYHVVFKKMNDSLLNDNNKRSTIQAELNYNYDKIKIQDSIRSIEKQKILKAKFDKEKSERRALYIILSLIFIFAIFMINRFRNSQKKNKIISLQKNLVEEKNKEITDSITYAKRIQSAILPSTHLIQSALPESFIIYKPKDIVAGDFYWFEVIDKLIFLAAADCTGHGVPGAMVSVVCHNALNRSVKEFKLKNPNEILDKTREIVITEFEKSDEEVKDGMDISLCVLDLQKKKLNWSGAHNPLWILRNNEIIEFKGDKQPIGKYADAKDFTLHEIPLQTNDILYIFTDGYQDQFGGEKGKKFKTSQMRDLFLSISEKSMEEQSKIIEQSFELWKGNLEQVDDVCIIGVSI